MFSVYTTAKVTLFGGKTAKCREKFVSSRPKRDKTMTEKKETTPRGREQEGLRALGKKTDYRSDYAPEVLETFLNKHPENDYWVRFNCPEFTSLCPITGQPDFAEIRISYIPAERMVESKSLKLYLFSFRNHGDFHEDCVNIIMKDLIRLMDPKYIYSPGRYQYSSLRQLWKAWHPIRTIGLGTFRSSRVIGRSLFA